MWLSSGEDLPGTANLHSVAKCRRSPSPLRSSPHVVRRATSAASCARERFSSGGPSSSSNRAYSIDPRRSSRRRVRRLQRCNIERLALCEEGDEGALRNAFSASVQLQDKQHYCLHLCSQHCRRNGVAIRQATLQSRQDKRRSIPNTGHHSEEHSSW